MQFVRITVKIEKERTEDYRERMQHLKMAVLLS